MIGIFRQVWLKYDSNNYEGRPRTVGMCVHVYVCESSVRKTRNSQLIDLALRPVLP